MGHGPANRLSPDLAVTIAPRSTGTWSEKTHTGDSAVRLTFRSNGAHPEIEAAIKSMSERKSEPVRERIVVLPTTMKIKYEHTCSRCGCHVGSIPGTSFGGGVWICAYCDHAQWAGRR